MICNSNFSFCFQHLQSVFPTDRQIKKERLCRWPMDLSLIISVNNHTNNDTNWYCNEASKFEYSSRESVTYLGKSREISLRNRGPTSLGTNSDALIAICAVSGKICKNPYADSSDEDQHHTRDLVAVRRDKRLFSRQANDASDEGWSLGIIRETGPFIGVGN